MIHLRCVLMLGLLLALPGAAACGGKANVASESGGSANSDGSGGAGAIGGNEPGGNGVGGDSPDPCAEFKNETGPSDTTIRFRNTLSIPIYLPRNCARIDFELEPTAPVDPNAPVPDLRSENCSYDCEVKTPGRPGNCFCNETLTILAPGEVYDEVREGTATTYVSIPGTGCFPEEITLEECRRTVPAVAQTYAVDIFAFDSCEGDCGCFSDGLCTGTGEGTPLVPAPTTFAYPEQALVEVTFQE